MALKSAENLGGDYLDLKQLPEPTVIVFRLREFEPAEKGKFGYILPTIADAFIVDGEKAGEVHLNEKFLGAITSALRGVRNPNAAKGEKPQPPVNEVGEEIVVRVDVKLRGEQNAYAVGDAPSATELAAAEKAYEAAGGAKLWESAGAELATAGAGAGKASRPWD